MIKFLRLHSIQSLDADTQESLRRQASGSNLLLKQLKLHLKKEIDTIDKKMMSDELFDNVNAYSDRIAKLMGARRQLCDIIKLLEE